MRREWLGLAGFTAALAVLVASCTSAASTLQDRPGHVTVDPDHEVILTMESGPAVRVPAHSVAGTGQLAGNVVPGPGSPPDGLVLAGSAYELAISGTRLTGPVTLTFPAPPAGQAPDGSSPASAALAFFDTTVQAWTPVESEFDPNTNTLTATSNHLSTWAVLRTDTNKIIKGAKDIVSGIIGTNDHVDNPRCDNESGTNDAGISVTSSDGDLVKWCVGTSDGAPQVKVADNRGYAVAVSYPASWAAKRIGGPNDVEQAAINAVSRFAAPVSPGRKVDVIAPGKGLQFTVPRGATGTVQVQPSAEAYLLSGLLFGLDTVAMTFDSLPWFNVKPEPSKTAKALSAMFTGKDCATKMSTLAASDVATAHAVGELFRNVAGLATSCLADHWPAAYGLTGAIRSTALGVLIWLTDGVKLAFAGVGAAIDTAMYFNGYQLRVSQAASRSGAPAAPATGTSVPDGIPSAPPTSSNADLAALFTGSTLATGGTSSPGTTFILHGRRLREALGFCWWLRPNSDGCAQKAAETTLSFSMGGSSSFGFRLGVADLSPPDCRARVVVQAGQSTVLDQEFSSGEYRDIYFNTGGAVIMQVKVTPISGTRSTTTRCSAVMGDALRT